MNGRYLARVTGVGDPGLNEVKSGSNLLERQSRISRSLAWGRATFGPDPLAPRNKKRQHASPHEVRARGGGDGLVANIVVAGLDSATHAEKRFTRTAAGLLRHCSTDHRVKPGGD
jgi:hypothetical protein